MANSVGYIAEKGLDRILLNSEQEFELFLKTSPVYVLKRVAKRFEDRPETVEALWKEAKPTVEDFLKLRIDMLQEAGWDVAGWSVMEWRRLPEQLRKEPVAGLARFSQDRNRRIKRYNPKDSPGNPRSGETTTLKRLGAQGTPDAISMDDARPRWGWMDYDDMGRVLELTVVFDDVLKKNPRFLRYSVLLANRICEDLGIKAVVTWGKWGGRLEYKFNKNMTSAELEAVAVRISSHKAWKALMESTRVFTYGNQSDE